MKVVLAYNPNAGKRISANQLYSLFKKYDITIEQSIHFSDDTKPELQKHIKNGSIIAVVGGDGTISSVVDMIAGSKAVLMPLPGGTLNHFTKDLGIDQDIEMAIKQAAQSKPRAVDIARVNGTVFINNSSIGLYPFAVQVRSHFEDTLGKWPAALIGSIRALVRYRLYSVTIGSETIQTPFIFVGNNDYHLDSLDSSGRQKVNEGVLSVYVLKARNIWQLIKVLGAFLRGNLHQTPEAKIWNAKSVTIHSRRKTIRIARDGETQKLPTPLEYSIEPGALRVIGSS